MKRIARILRRYFSRIIRLTSAQMMSIAIISICFSYMTSAGDNVLFTIMTFCFFFVLMDIMSRKDDEWDGVDSLHGKIN